jgi:thermostable 8-oxoguanine DNA glycosylase
MNTEAGIEWILHDQKLATARIENRDKDFYDIKSVSDLLLDEKDFVAAREVAEKEAHIIFNGDLMLTREGIYRGIVYSLLTPLQKYAGQVKGFESLLYNNLVFTAGNRSDPDTVAATLKNAGVLFYHQKARYMLDAEHVVSNTDILSKIQVDAGTTKEREIALRKEIIAKVNGLGLKTGSVLLRMCGARYIVPVDSWMGEMLYFHGYPCEMPRSKAKRPRWNSKDDDSTSAKQRKKALSEKQYLEAETFAFDLAGKYDVPGYILQLAFWTKKSSYGK